MAAIALNPTRSFIGAAAAIPYVHIVSNLIGYVAAALRRIFLLNRGCPKRGDPPLWIDMDRGLQAANRSLYVRFMAAQHAVGAA